MNNSIESQPFLQKQRVCYVSLGSNMGKPEENLAIARSKIEETEPFSGYSNALKPITITAQSRVYMTEPQNVKEQPFFANQVVQLTCVNEVTPVMLLHRLLGIEQEMGRKRSLRFGPRVIDLDLLLVEGITMETDELTLPHPRMADRAFVLVPLLEIAEGLVYPDKTLVAQKLENLDYSVKENLIYQE